MIRTADWARALSQAGYSLAAGVPCSSLSPLQDHLQGAPGFTYVAAPNEGMAVAVASGAVMAGRRALALMQNSGLGNAINPLTSLVETFGLPLLLVTSWRGQPGRPDEPQHRRMGLSTHAMLDAIGIAHATLDPDGDAAGQLRWAIECAEAQRRCVALVVPDGAFERTRPGAAEAQSPDLAIGRQPCIPEDLRRHGALLSRIAALDIVRGAAGDDAILLATTGKTGRELFALRDDPGNLYIVGSMGLASSVGLGLGLGLRLGLGLGLGSSGARRVVIVDGDGAALMHLGALPMLARYGNDRLLHVILDNGTYDSTGGQASISSNTPFADIAARCAYAYAACADDAAGLAQALRDARRGPALIHLKVRPGSQPDLPRPTLTPPRVLRRMQDHFRISP